MKTILAFLCLTSVVVAAPIDVYIVAGDDNALGYASNTITDSRVPYSFNLQRNYMQAVANDQKLGTIFDTGGAELTLGKSLRDGGDSVAIVKVAFKGLTLKSWADIDGLLSTRLKTAVDMMFTSLSNQSLTPRVAGIAFIHGDTDANDQAAANSYGTRLSHLVTAWRNDFNSPPIAMLRLSSKINLPFAATIRNAQQAAAQSLAITVLNGDDLAVVNSRLTDAAQTELGYRFANVFDQDPDLNGDRVVNGDDFLKWQRERVDPQVLNNWKASYAAQTSSVQTVPEPSGIVLLLLAGLWRRTK